METLALNLAGGRGSRLDKLTKKLYHKIENLFLTNCECTIII